MKKLFLHATKSFILICILIQIQDKAKATPGKTDGNEIQVFIATEFESIAKPLLNSFERNDYKLMVTTMEKQTKPLGEFLNGSKGFGLVTRDYFSEGDWNNLWFSVIGREIVVSVINKSNPYYSELLKQGLNIGTLTDLLTTSEIPDWEILVSNGKKTVIPIFIENNLWVECSISKLTTKRDHKTVNGEIVAVEDLLLNIRNNPNSIGICRLSSLCTFNNDFAEGFQLVPFDANANHTLDGYENIYSSFDSFIRGVWIGKYPKELIHPIYLVSTHKPSSTIEVDFTNWMLNEGQDELYAQGIYPLVENEKKLRISELNRNFPIEQASINESNLIKVLLGFVGSVLLVSIIGWWVMKFIDKKRRRNPRIDLHTCNSSEKNIAIPGGLFYDKSHTWSFMEKDGNIRIGLDDFISSITGDITGIVLKRNGEQVHRGDKIIEISQYGKKLEFKSPVSGIVKFTNSQLIKDPGLICSSPFNEGWIYVIEPSNWTREIQLMLLADKFIIWLKLEYNRLKDFLVSATNNEMTLVTLQEGGELKKGVLADYCPKTWEDFQTYFIDSTM